MLEIKDFSIKVGNKYLIKLVDAGTVWETMPVNFGSGWVWGAGQG